MLIHHDISSEEFREVYFVESGQRIRIENPVSLYVREGGKCQRIVDAEGVAYCYAGPETGRTVVMWKSKPGNPPVSF